VQPLQDLLDLQGPVADIRCIQNVTGLIRILSAGAQELFDFQLDRQADTHSRFGEQAMLWMATSFFQGYSIWLIKIVVMALRVGVASGRDPVKLAGTSAIGIGHPSLR
jgi:hypothetical protein